MGLLGAALALAGATQSATAAGGGASAARGGRTGAVGFDPPATFAQALPLRGYDMGDPATAMSFAAGDGAVLGDAAAFGVSGVGGSAFLAFDCKARNRDGSVPRLPMVVRFPDPVGSVNLKVATPTPAGATVTLEGLDARGRVVVRNAGLRVSPTMGEAGITTGRAGSTPRRIIAALRLSGPCALAVDDIVTFNGPATWRATRRPAGAAGPSFDPRPAKPGAPDPSFEDHAMSGLLISHVACEEPPPGAIAASAGAKPASGAAPAASWLARLARGMATWRRVRRATRQLHALDDQLLRDIGLYRCGIGHAARFGRD